MGVIWNCQVAGCHGTNEKYTRQVGIVRCIKAKVAKDVSQHPIIRDDRDHIWENSGSGQDQVTEYYVLDDDNNDSVKIKGLVLY